MGDNTQTAAKANPSQKFAIVDYNYSPVISEHRRAGLQHRAGRLPRRLPGRGHESKTGKVATFGGQKLPTVTIYMDGFWDGVQYYNQQHHAQRQGAGLERADPERQLHRQLHQPDRRARRSPRRSSPRAPTSSSRSRATSGLGAAKAVQNADTAAGAQKVNMMWVDTDGCVSAPQYCKYFISSVTKGIQAGGEERRPDRGQRHVQGRQLHRHPGQRRGRRCRRSTTSPARCPPRCSPSWPRSRRRSSAAQIKPATKSPV